MSADFFTGSGLQSGFVLAVLIAAVLLANHLGGSAGLMKRITQVALGLVLMLLIFSATAAFHGPAAIPPAELATTFDSEEQFLAMSSESAQRNSEIGTIHIGLGIIFVALGVVLLRRLRDISPALMLGGVLLILVGVPGGGGGVGEANSLVALLSAFVPGSLSDSGSAHEIARFIVLLVGVVLLTGLIYFRWERESTGNSTEAANS